MTPSAPGGGGRHLAAAASGCTRRATGLPRGHRLRVQVSSGAHPRYARNTGTDEPLGEATRLVAADVEIFHDPERPSAVALPVWMRRSLALGEPHLRLLREVDRAAR